MRRHTADVNLRVFIQVAHFGSHTMVNAVSLPQRDELGYASLPVLHCGIARTSGAYCIKVCAIMSAEGCGLVARILASVILATRI